MVWLHGGEVLAGVPGAAPGDLAKTAVGKEGLRAQFAPCEFLWEAMGFELLQGAWM